MTQDAVQGGGHERLGLLVVGMHRSGTSAATRIISLLGPRLPSNLMPASAEFNASGFWESLDVVALNEELLAAAQSSWDDALPVDPARLPAGVVAQFREDAGKILDDEFGATDWFVLKDPRIGRLLAPWLEAVRGAGARPLVVIPVRHPSEVAASLLRREGFPEEKSFYLWVRHQVDVLRSSRGETRGVMIYDELMADWRSAVQRLARDLGIRWPRGLDEVAEEAGSFLDPALRHHQVSRPTDQHSLPARLAWELYEALCTRSTEIDALADAIDQQLAPAEALFAPLQRDAMRRMAALQAKMDATLRKERAVHAQLAADFDDKVRHVQFLEKDREDLAAQRDRGVAQIRELEATLATERSAFAQLSASFSEKEQHVLALMGQLKELSDALEEARIVIARIDTVLS